MATNILSATDRRTGQTLHLVASASVPSKFHVVCADRCDCRGFSARGRCAHLDRIRAAATPRQPQPVTIPDAVAAKAAEYRAIFGEDEAPRPGKVSLVSRLMA